MVLDRNDAGGDDDEASGTVLGTLHIHKLTDCSHPLYQAPRGVSLRALADPGGSSTSRPRALLLPLLIPGFMPLRSQATLRQNHPHFTEVGNRLPEMAKDAQLLSD